MSNSLWPHGLQHARLPFPSPPTGACSNSCPSSQWCHPTISSSVVPFSSCLQSFPESGSFPVSQFFASGNLTVAISPAIPLALCFDDQASLHWLSWTNILLYLFICIFIHIYSFWKYLNSNCMPRYEARTLGKSYSGSRNRCGSFSPEACTLGEETNGNQIATLFDRMR